ncbi:hypothetical protein ABPG72_017694, partial [Tetrahymena utriculariae]
MAYYQRFLETQEQLQINHGGISQKIAYIIQSNNYSTESQSFEITFECKSYEIKQLQIDTNNEELKERIEQYELYKQFMENQQFILQVLEKQGYKLDCIIQGSENCILISGLHQQNKKQIAIKIVNDKNNQDEKQIHELLNKTKEIKYFIECIEHIRIMNWNCFVFKRYSSSLTQECENYKQNLKQFNEQHFLNNVFDLFHGLIDLRRLGILHLDIKPDNILVNEDGNLFYCDFGISQIKKQGEEIQVRGFSKAFAPQEQINKELNNQIDFETDVYSLGKTLNILINLFRKSNPKNSITSFVNNLEEIINSQMIQENIKQRKNCYEIYSQLHDHFIQIPEEFISEKLKKDHVDYYFEDIYQALAQAKDQIKKLGSPKDYQSLNNKNKQYIKRLIQELQDQKRFQKDQSKESIDKQVQEELQFFQERFQNLVFNSKQNIYFDMKFFKNFDETLNQMNHQNLKQRNQIETEILLSNTREYEKYINLLRIKLIEQEALIYELNNSFIKYLLKYIDAHQNRYLEQSMSKYHLNQVLLEQDYIQGIKSFLAELKRCKTAEILCLLKQISIEGLKQLQNDLNNLQYSYKKKLGGQIVQNLAESSLFIMEFYNQIKHTILQQRLKQFTFSGFRELLQTTQPNDIYIKDNEKIGLDFIIICVEVQLKKLTQQEQINLFKDVNSKDKSQIINELNEHQINELSQQISICLLCTQNIQQFTQTKEDKFSIQATQQMFNKII